MKNCTRILLLQVLFVFLLTPLVYAGETGKIAGFVFDEQSGEPLVGANVIVNAIWQGNEEVKLEEPRGAATGMDGDFFILNLRPGIYSVEVVYVGYNGKLLTHVQVFVDKTTRLEFKLSSEVLTGEEITVTAFKPQQVETDVTATKQVYNVADIEAVAGVADISDILALQVDVVDDHFRGGREGESSYLLGGGTIVNPLTNKRAFSPIVSGLEQVEVYTSGFSAEYGNAQSGVVNMVTKEGNAKWKTRFESAVTMPYYKTWQGSAYDEKNLYFYDLLKNTDEWLKENPTQPGKPLYDAGYGFGPSYLPYVISWPPVIYDHGDSLKVARLGQLLWLQSVRDVGMKYNKTMDSRFDFTTGGPLNNKSNIFIAARQTISYPDIPTVEPNLERQIMMNLVYRPTTSDKVKLSYIYDLGRSHKFNNFLRYMFDRTINVKKLENVSMQYGLEWSHVLSPATFVEAKFNILDLINRTRLDLLEDGQFIEDYSNGTNWVDYTGPSFHRVGRPEDDSGDQRTQSFNYQLNMISQLNNNNLVKAGIQLTNYNVDVDMDVGLTTAGNYRMLKFQVQPYEGALFIQDKMEFEGLIANLGLRMDFYDLNTEYFNNIYSPLQSKGMTKTKPYVRLQPRIGISFPVSATSVFHLNYGTFTQRPTFNQLFYNQITDKQVFILGNPRLKPENTKAYDVGFVQGLPFGFRLDVSAYYKDVKDLVQSAYYTNSTLSTYQTFENRDYADIKGFHISLEKKTSSISGYLRYNYESATGKSSNDINAPVNYYETPDLDEGSVKLPDKEDVYMDYDRTHKALINLRYQTNSKSGPDWGWLRPLAGISISTTFRISSGRPYTWDESGQGLKFNRRTPVEREWKLRLQKKLYFDAYTVTAYAEGFNLLNEMYYSYSRTFDDARETGRWQYDRENILIYDQYPPYTTSQAIYLLRNEPRHYRAGLIFNF